MTQFNQRTGYQNVFINLVPLEPCEAEEVVGMSHLYQRGQRGRKRCVQKSRNQLELITDINVPFNSQISALSSTLFNLPQKNLLWVPMKESQLIISSLILSSNTHRVESREAPSRIKADSIPQPAPLHFFSQRQWEANIKAEATSFLRDNFSSLLFPSKSQNT